MSDIKKLKKNIVPVAHEKDVQGVIDLVVESGRAIVFVPGRLTRWCGFKSRDAFALFLLENVYQDWDNRIFQNILKSCMIPVPTPPPTPPEPAVEVPAEVPPKDVESVELPTEPVPEPVEAKEEVPVTWPEPSPVDEGKVAAAQAEFDKRMKALKEEFFGSGVKGEVGE